jgi:putative flippase GtrA
LASLDLNHLQPNGFKILLEILAGTPSLKVVERPFTFAARFSGESKANWREGLRYVLGLARLRMTVSHPALRRVMVVVCFGLVGVSGLVVNSAVLWALVAGWGAPILVGAALATQVSTVWTYLLTDLLVFHGKKTRPAWLRFAGFALLNNALLLARLPVLFWLVQGVGLAYVPANLVTLLAAFTIRFAASDHLLFTRRNAMTLLDTRRAKHASDGDTARTGPVDLLVDIRPEAAPVVRCREVELPWRYDIHGLVRIASVVRLTELDSFASIAPASADIEIRRGEIGDGRWRARTKVTQFAGVPAVSYQEHLGRFGSDFCVDMTGGTIQVNVGPMLVRSPHVLYTNVVEALLRFVLVARDHMLLHSACLDLGGRGVLLSALTDTGKTGTVLRLLRENDARFLSDDMTVLCPDGTALAYPKPMTISQHTLRAVNVGDLSRREWRKLRLQSRLHSKEGRSIGSRLGSMNLPIMTLNALTQWVVPPPKYEVERLVPCRQARSVRIDELFVIARGDLGLSEIAAGDDLVDELLANTDDAYGFPPFRYFAPALVVGGLAYEELRARERNILAAAISGIRAHRLVTPDFSWADRIPDVVRSRDAAMSGDEDPPTTAVPVDLLPTPRREWLAASGSTSAPVSSPSEPAAF